MKDMVALFQAGEWCLFEQKAREAIRRWPASPLGWKALGNLSLSQGRYADALESFGQCLQLAPEDAQAHHNLGASLLGLGRLEEAAASLRRSLALKPDYAQAENNLGITLLELGRLEEAVTCYRKSLTLMPDFAEARNNLGNALKELGRPEEAEAEYRKALAVRPDFAEAHSNLGIVLKELRRYEDAVACYQNALAIKPDYADAYNNLGNTLGEVQQHEEAAACYKKVLSINPDHTSALGMYCYSKMQSCNWEEMDDIFRALLDGIDASKAVASPFSLLAIPSTPAQQKHCAEIHILDKFPEVQTSRIINDRYSHSKIRIGYFSADFYNHATAYLMAELFEKHDRTKFEVIGFSYGASPNDYMHQRVSASFDRFIDISFYSDHDIAILAKSLAIDIAIDLKGFTNYARTGIFARHPAPIQVNYLGYPGTMGAPYIDYLVADPTLIPVEHQEFYNEKIVYLPDSYQVNDSHKRISERQFTRNELGLPDEGFVFCCFNNNFKITPAIFNIWMQLLQQVEGSVLWLFEGNALAGQNLRNEAMKRGIAPERLVFAPHMDLSDHLARHRVADLFLDTFFYNAHTTASDALWASLPVLTYLGDTFAGRVSASLLNAVGLPELITHSHEEYQALALELATDPAKLASLRRKLAQNRLTHPLFDTVLFTRHIEDAYTQMWVRHQASLLPDHIYVKN